MCTLYMLHVRHTLYCLQKVLNRSGTERGISVLCSNKAQVGDQTVYKLLPLCISSLLRDFCNDQNQS